MRARLASALCSLTIVAGTAAAQPDRRAPGPPPPQPRPVPKIEKTLPPVPLVGLAELGAFAPERGFLDDVFTTDGTRMALVVTDGAAEVQVQVIGTADAGEIASFSVAAVAPAVRRLYLLGDRLFVVSDDDPGKPVHGTLVGFDGTVVKAYKHKPATDIFLRTVNGQLAVIAHTRDPLARAGTLLQAEAFELLKGKKLGKKPGRLMLGRDGRDAKLDFTPHYFIDDMTVAVGTRGGVWRKAEDQRSPNTAAAWNLLTAAWVKDEPITDLLGRARQVEVMTETPEHLFARMKEDNSEVEVWQDGVPRPLTLDQPLPLYTAASLAYAMRGDKLWVSLQIDPVNAAAVARKKADAEYLDLFEVDGDRATRRARVIAPRKKLRWGWVGDVLWVMEKNVGFDRGSKLITLYRPSDKR